MDNCLGQNKNNYVLRLPAYLTMKKYFESVQIVFLVAGHTKNTADRLFNLLKIDYKKENIFSLAELIRVCNQSTYFTAHKVDWKVFDNWNEYLDIYFNKYEAIKKYRIFQAGKELIGLIMCYEDDLDDTIPVEDMLTKKNIPAGVPISPNQLYTERKGVREIKAVGLYENFAGLIDPIYHDEMCPMPVLDVWIQVKNYYPIGTKIEREFKKNGRVLTTVVVDFDLETKLYALKWEEENTDTEIENNRIFTFYTQEYYNSIFSSITIQKALLLMEILYTTYYHSNHTLSFYSTSLICIFNKQ